MIPGYFPSTYFAKDFWQEDYWQDYGTAVTVSASLLSPGYFQSTLFPKGYAHEDYWPDYGTGGGSLLTPGYFQPAIFPKAFFHEDYWQDYGTDIIIVVPPTVEVVASPHGGVGYRGEPAHVRELREILDRDDRELQEILTLILTSGVIE